MTMAEEEAIFSCVTVCFEQQEKPSRTAHSRCLAAIGQNRVTCSLLIQSQVGVGLSSLDERKEGCKLQWLRSWRLSKCWGSMNKKKEGNGS
jgi:hypothetical protein